MSEEVKKEVELKVYLAGLEDVPKFIESIDLSRFFYALQDAKEVALAEPTKENLNEYVKASRLFFEINGNLLTLVDAYMQTKYEQSK